MTCLFQDESLTNTFFPGWLSWLLTSLSLRGGHRHQRSCALRHVREPPSLSGGDGKGWKCGVHWPKSLVVWFLDARTRGSSSCLAKVTANSMLPECSSNPTSQENFCSCWLIVGSCLGSLTIQWDSLDRILAKLVSGCDTCSKRNENSLAATASSMLLNQLMFFHIFSLLLTQSFPKTCTSQ